MLQMIQITFKYKLFPQAIFSYISYWITPGKSIHPFDCGPAGNLLGPGEKHFVWAFQSDQDMYNYYLAVIAITL
jgi:hypothetical protein